MKQRILGILALALLAVPMGAHAVTMILDATSIDPSARSSFSITFEDTGDGLFSQEEFVSFSGIDAFGLNFPYFLSVPFIDGIAVQYVHPACSFYSGLWCFTNLVNAAGFNSADFTYSISPATTDVPESGTLALLGLSLAGLGLTRQRKAD